MSDDDIFHNVIMSEERLQEEGFNEGRNDGRKTGLQEGYRLGWEKGSGIGSEVGFYSGFAKSLLEEIGCDEDASISQRVVKSLQIVETLCEQFPLTDPQHPELQEKLEEIRAKFKQGMERVSAYQRSHRINCRGDESRAQKCDRFSNHLEPDAESIEENSTDTI